MELKDFKKFEKSIGYEFKNKDLLKEALTHRSYLNENHKWKLPHNERLEFLGDAVLELAVTEDLFEDFPDYEEGTLTAYRAALVNYQMMAKVAQEAGIEKYILLSHGESKDTSGRAREVILANACEALIGAIYMDSGYGSAKKFSDKFVMTHLKEVIKTGLYKDAKSLLQEKTQAETKQTPSYKVLSEYGPDHKKSFKVGVYLGERLLATGEGLAKQDAEVDAAKKALKELD
ncbi:MAG: ribonuclease III [Candidatus Pacebacteria bacterium]|nr:ribonuclease III [Candidatus Paceibacterota bacterium]